MSATTNSVSSPASILFAKNLNKSAVRRNSFSQFGVKPRLPPELIGLRTSIVCLVDHGCLIFLGNRYHIFLNYSCLILRSYGLRFISKPYLFNDQCSNDHQIQRDQYI